MSRKHKMLVCGACGYLGRNLCDFLLGRGCAVIGVDLKDWGGPKHENFTFCRANLAERDFFRQFPDDCEAVFFLTGLSGTARSFDNYENFLYVNELSLLHLLDALRFKKIRPMVVFPSTRLVFRGERGQALVEDSRKETKTIYAANKIACEAYLEAYSKAFGIDFRILRICVPYGNLPGLSYSYGTIGFFLKQAQQGEITLYGDGSLRRTFTHVKDVSRQLCALVHSEPSGGCVYNSCGENYTLLEVAQWIAEKFHAKITFLPFPELEWRLESGDTVFDGEKMRSILPDPVQCSLKTWLAEL